MTDLKQTPLHSWHRENGARLGEFGGYELPVQYSGIVEEHRAARENVAVFDTCHMGEFEISGKSAENDLQRLVSSDIAGLRPGRCRYGLLCNPGGGVIDDLLVYRRDDSSFMVVVNAGTRAEDLAWMKRHCSPGTTIEDRTEKTVKIDVQGPSAPRLAASLLDHDIAGMRFYRFAQNSFRGVPLLISRTGYTGEIGFEMYTPLESGMPLWEALIAGGAKPAGLGARDTLRLEIGMPLYGQELSGDRNAAESGMDRPIDLNKEFIGAEAIRDYLPRDILRGIVFPGRKAARAGDTVLDSGNRSIGTITSGALAPSLGHSVALAYLQPDRAEDGMAIHVDRGRKPLEGKIATPPFYRHGTARRPLAEFL